MTKQEFLDMLNTLPESLKAGVLMAEAESKTSVLNEEERALILKTYRDYNPLEA